MKRLSIHSVIGGLLYRINWERKCLLHQRLPSRVRPRGYRWWYSIYDDLRDLNDIIKTLPDWINYWKVWRWSSALGILDFLEIDQWRFFRWVNISHWFRHLVGNHHFKGEDNSFLKFIALTTLRLMFLICLRLPFGFLVFNKINLCDFRSATLK